MNSSNQRVILLVEDEVVVAKSTAKTIQQFGYEVILSHSGTDAVSIVTENDTVDLVLMDINLGRDFDGTKAAKQILAVRELPIVFLSSYTEEAYVNRIKEITRYGYVTKNSGDYVLKSSIEMAFELFQQYQQTRISEQRYRELLDSISDSVYVLDKNWIHVIVNDAAEKFTGIAKEDLIGNSLLTLFPGVEDSDFFKTFQQVMQSRKPGIVQNQFTFPDGRVGWYEVNVYPVPEGILCIASDITDRKNAEQALKESEQRLQFILTSSHDIIIMQDLDGKYLYYNGLTDLGLTREDVLGKDPYFFFDAETANNMMGLVKKVTQERKSMITERKIEWEGETQWFLDEMHPVFDNNGQVIGTTLFSKNITSRKLAEEELTMYQLITATVNDPMSFINTDYTYRIVNDAYAQFFAYSQHDLVGKTPIEMLGQKLFEEQIKPNLDRCFNGEEIHFQLWLDSPALGRRYMDMSYYPFMTDDRTVIGAITHGRDITDLMKTAQQLQAANAAKDKFFGIIAHDLRNPVYTFGNAIELLKLHFKDTSDKLTRSVLYGFEEKYKQLLLLLENLLEWSRVQLGEITCHPVKLELYPMVEQIWDLIKQSVPHKQISFQCLLDNQARCYADQDMVQFIFRNLLTNALKFTRKGGTITVNGELKDDMVVITVTDTGVGIPESHLKKLFQIGNQNVSIQGTDGEEGTGLGLILCKEFVTKHGCDIWIESQEGKGSTVFFTLPTLDRMQRSRVNTSSPKTE